MSDLVTTGALLVIVGFGVVLISMLRSERRESGVKGGGVVLVGPIPIVFGSDMKWASVAIFLAIALILLTLLVGWA